MGPRPNTASLGPSPLPQEERGVGKVPVRVIDGFTQFLPKRSTIFFQRCYFAPFPRPLQVGLQPPFPFDVPIARIQAPRTMAIVFREASFRVYQHSGIGVEDIEETPRSRVTTYIGFNFKVGNRGLTDFSTNVQAPNTPVLFGGPNNPNATTVQGGSGTIYPFSGRVTPEQPYAYYSMPGDLIEANAVILRAPNFDARLFSVEMSGWIVGATELQKILDSL